LPKAAPRANSPAIHPKAAPLLDTPSSPALRSAKDWIKLLAPYRSPDHRRSVIEIAVTIIPFCALWWLAYLAMSVHYAFTLAICVVAAAFLMRIFLVQHDCGHGAFFADQKANDWVGRIAGVFTMTPYQVWRHSHAKHHATSGDLDRRGWGDIDTITVREFKAMGRWERIGYRIYRFPLVMFGIGPVFVFMLKQRLPFGFFKAGQMFWISAMGTNLAIAALWGGMMWLVGWQAFLWVHLPICIFCGTMGVWLFYVQHQFEDSYWADHQNWTAEEAALYGSSHYDLPAPIRWVTANIGIHHVHHLYSRIPFYKLPDVLQAFPELADIRRFGFIESLSCIRLRFWDEEQRRMVSVKEALA
jgi:acyl-lipid omega-6 desaturase (Delta-12 desaturase)